MKAPFTFRSLVTRLFYSVSINNVPTFPANDASPTMFSSNICGVDLQSSSAWRFDRLFNITILGNFNKAKIKKLSMSLTQALQNMTGELVVICLLSLLLCNMLREFFILYHVWLVCYFVSRLVSLLVCIMFG